MNTTNWLLQCAQNKLNNLDMFDLHVHARPIALLLGLIGLGAFLWALKSGQFDDLEGAAHRILDDDESSESVDKKSKN